MKNIIRNTVVSMAFISLFSMAYAEDIDIIDTEKNPIPPNILFVVDGSGSMDELVAATGNTRMDTVKNALITLISGSDLDGINIGVMSFSNTITNGGVVTPFASNHNVHGPAYPVSIIDGDTNGDNVQDQSAEDVLRTNGSFTVLSDSYLPAVGSATENTRTYTQRLISQWGTGGGTPIVGALFEAAKYMRGDNLYWGNLPPNRIESAHPSTYTGGVADGSVTSVETCDLLFGTQSCDRTTTCTAARNFSCGMGNGASYQSATDVLGDACTLNNPTPLMYCPQGDTVCGIGTAATCTFTTIPEHVAHNQLCSSATSPEDCNLLPAFSNCAVKALEGSTSGIYCDKTTAAWDRYKCPTTPPAQPYKCYHQEEICKQNKCRTESGSALVYKSPINTECQNNAIILLSDGSPSVNDSAPLVTDMIGSVEANNCKGKTRPTDIYDWSSSVAINYYGRCGEELATFLANTDNSQTVAGDQPINLYTIGFALSAEPDAEQYLADLATAGGGAAYTAGDEANLITAFKDAVIGASSKARVFSSPTYQVSSSQSLLHGSHVYLPMFNARSGPRWSGNLKKFSQVDGVIKAKDGTDLYNANGNIVGSAKDIWSTATSTGSNAVTSGGAASRLDPATRKVLTDDGTPTLPLLDTVTEAQLGVVSPGWRAALINFAIGFKTDRVTPRHAMGDIIHSKPIYFPYHGLSRPKGGIIFVGTNEGYLHAINDLDGTEEFAYMPQELLKNIKHLKNNNTNVDHPYGVDGPITLRFDDKNKNGQVDSADGDTVTLYFGLRRGGKTYYALDVTNPSTPKLKWKINNDSNFNELGFTWSKPKFAKMRVGSALKPVLIFGGGYVDDNAGELDNSGTGSSVYIVNADTGDLIWKPADAAISYAVAANIREVDVDRDGAIDRLYFGDTGGTIWRVDLNVTAASANSTHGLVKARIVPFAKLGDVSAPATTLRKFFNEPDVAIFRRNGKLNLTIAIGSGDRANPLDPNGDDRFFVLFDKNVSDVPTTTPPALEIGDLDPQGSATATSAGWQLDLTKMPGEKVLSTALTFQSNIMFASFGQGSTTTLPTAANDCSVSTSNQSRIYLMDLLTGKPSLDLDHDPADPSAPLDSDDISVIGQPGVIMETPQVVFTTMQAKDGTACVKGNCIRGFSIPGVATSSTPGANKGLKKSLPRVYWIDKD